MRKPSNDAPFEMSSGNTENVESEYTNRFGHGGAGTPVDPQAESSGDAHGDHGVGVALL